MTTDGPWLVIALALYGGAAVAAVLGAVRRKGGFILAIALLVVALGAHTVAIGVRWLRLGHGPYVDLAEVLSSNVWSLHLAVLIACLAVRQIRPVLAVLLPVLQVPVLWLLSLTPVDTAVPVTYDTVWLAVHVWLGKVFLGCVVVAVGLSLVVVGRRLRTESAFARLPASSALNELAYRFILVAFVFESLMLVAGALWARDAWGRYWAWDPLETWAFLTWLAVVGFLHLRATRQPAPAVAAALVIGIFVLAFSTLFGMPFVSTAPHKGAV